MEKHRSSPTRAEGPYRAGRRHGLWTWWSNDETISAEGLYRAGRRVGIWRRLSRTMIRPGPSIYEYGLTPVDENSPRGVGATSRMSGRALRELLFGGESDDWIQAYWELLRYGGQQHLPLLAEYLATHPEQVWRWGSVLVRIGHPDALPLFEEVVGQVDEKMKWTARGRLLELRLTLAADPLPIFIRAAQKEPWSAMFALKSIGPIVDRRYLPALEAMDLQPPAGPLKVRRSGWNDSLNQWIVYLRAEAAIRDGEEESVETLVRRMPEKRGSYRPSMEAHRKLIARGARMVPELLDLLEQGLVPLDDAAAGGPLWLRGQQGLPYRSGMIWVLGEVGDSRAERVLLAALDDSTTTTQLNSRCIPAVRAFRHPADEAAFSLGRIGMASAAETHLRDAIARAPEEWTRRALERRLALVVEGSRDRRSSIDGRPKRLTVMVTGSVPPGPPIVIHLVGEPESGVRMKRAVKGGFAVFPEVPPGRYRAVIYDRRLMSTETTVSIPGGLAELELLPPEVWGRVVDLKGQPVAGARVALVRGGTTSWRFLDSLPPERRHERVSARDGRFRLSSHGGSWGVLIEGAEGGVGFGRLEGISGVQDVLLRALSGRLIEGKEARVVLLNFDGTPLVGASVNRGGESTESDESGVVHLAYRPGATLEVRLGGSIRTATRETGASALTYRIEPGVTIRGRVRDARGPLGEGLGLSFSDPPFRNGWSVRTGEGGRFEAVRDDPPAGKLVLDVRSFPAGRFARTTLEAPALDADGVMDLGEIVLPRNPVVRGRVLDAGGRPVFGARVRIVGTPSSPRETRTDSHGRFRFNWSFPGPGTIQAIAEGSGPSPPLPVDLELDRELDLTLKLTPSGGRGAIEGTVRGGSPVSNTRFTVASANEAPRTPHTDDRGRFAVANLPAGEAIITITTCRLQLVHREWIVAGKTSKLELDLQYGRPPGSRRPEGCPE